MFPNYVIAGAPKCGTTSIYSWLRKHPEVCASTRKEVQFFMDRESSVFHPEDNYIDHGIAAYEKFFDGFQAEKHKVIFEATPGYIYQQTAIDAFAKDLPDTQLIFILREPASRLHSIYRYFTQNRGELDQSISFSEFVQKIKDKSADLQWNEFLRDGLLHGAYDEYLQKWSEACGKHRINVFLYEDFAKGEKNFTLNLAKMMNIDTSFFENFEFQAQNKTVQISNRSLHELARVASALIPFGSRRDTLRNAYFKFNGKEQNKNHDDETEKTMKDLKSFYQPYNTALAKKFEVDTNVWK